VAAWRLVVGGVLSNRQSAVPIETDGDHEGTALDVNEGGDM